ncbi:PepSY-associated TM helix domain-containing protein [Paenirhodobacter sp.]|uniref:PepSY-associated TM helix domain-containing protein n=1 Tax=Paenirhodobacter sp. TaxID=1965326 RepID=UPI003B514503
MNSSTQRGAQPSALYRMLWRWHFFAGLLTLPFVLILCITGAIYLFKDEINDRAYPGLRFVTPEAQAPQPASALIAAASAAQPGTVKTYLPAAAPGRSAEVRIATPEGGKASVFVNPWTAQVLGQQGDGGAAGSPAMLLVRKLHSLKYFGWVTERIIEGVAGWMILLSASGLYLWWPRGQTGGVVSVRGTPRKRVFWRDAHAVTGVFAAGFILFLALTGLPWSGCWGAKFYDFAYRAGMGMPDGYWDSVPVSTVPVKEVVDHAPWIMENQPVPLSSAAAGIPAKIDDVIATVEARGLAPGYALSIPAKPTGVFTTSVYPDDITRERVIHLDQYSGQVLFDMGLAELGLFGRLAEWGISFHMGQAFGRTNQLILLVALIAIAGLPLSGVVMWWKRRPAGRLAAPRLPVAEGAPWVLLSMAVVAGLFFPMVGLSMLVFAAVELAGLGLRRARHA